MVCPNCGFKDDSDSPHCLECGTRMPEADPQPAAPEEPTAAPESPASSPAAPTRPSIRDLVPAGVAVLLLLLGGGWVVVRDRPAPTPQAGPSREAFSPSASQPSLPIPSAPATTTVTVVATPAGALSTPEPRRSNPASAGRTSAPPATQPPLAVPPPAAKPAKPASLGPNPAGRNITASATSACRDGGWYVNVSATLVGFTDTHVIVHIQDGDGWGGFDVSGGPNRFSGPVPKSGALVSSQSSIAWFVWALDENSDVVTSDVGVTNRPTCAG